MTVYEALKIFKDRGLPELEAYLVIKKITGKTKEYLVIHPEYQFCEKNFFDLLNKRLIGFPLAYLLNEKSFYKHNFYVEEGVLIPRPETELLVENALKIINKEKIKKVAEIGVGSGAVIISILLERNCIGFGTDISKKALEIAKKNAKKFNVLDRLDLRLGKFLEPFKNEYDEIELIVSNPPYVKNNSDLQKEVMFEPKEALLGGEDGLDFYREFLSSYDLQGKIVIMEIGHDQGDFFRKKGWDVIKDYSGNDRIVIKDFRR
ncbi:release factor glutamine methyltransferase [Thermosipho japonicus]|uniref:peptide chain release factor N(5)-glutamine methyltransferase n=1 Tax=Thermosipho japonicus TaxID=90323 RepID=A0A841GQ34_9BACT|nr:peptide chain release factor N(5)-glutamine methyltransferase [Thermosipho japonicus]MBB6061689.1 release factor glutamine methyltransferase [Thermosipho japonicus]